MSGIFYNVDFRPLKIQTSQILSGYYFDCNFENMDFSNLGFHGHFIRCNLKNVFIQKSIFYDQNMVLAGCDLRGGNFREQLFEKNMLLNENDIKKYIQRNPIYEKYPGWQLILKEIEDGKIYDAILE